MWFNKTQFIKSKKTGGGTSKKKDDCTCGLDKTKRPCSMKECLEKKQVRFWGVNKIDSRLLSMGTTINMNKNRQELISQKIKHNAALKKLKSDLTYTNRRDTDKIKEINEKAAEHIKKKK